MCAYFDFVVFKLIGVNLKNSPDLNILVIYLKE